VRRGQSPERNIFENRLFREKIMDRRWMTWWEATEKHIVRSTAVCTVHKIYPCRGEGV